MPRVDKVVMGRKVAKARAGLQYQGLEFAAQPRVQHISQAVSQEIEP